MCYVKQQVKNRQYRVLPDYVDKHYWYGNSYKFVIYIFAAVVVCSVLYFVYL